MNERILDIADKVGIAVWGDAVYMYHPSDPLDSTVLAKFAELIVQECAKVADGGWADPGHQIKHHFGVEE